jgi:hypothetical protein
VSKSVEVLGVIRVLHIVVRAHKLPQDGVINTPIHVDEAHGGEVFVTSVATVYE